MQKKIIIAVIILIVLLGGGFAYAYFGTDAFKSDKEIFFSYLTENKDKQSKEIAQKLEEYLDKKENKAYTNKGKVSLNISGADDESLEMLNNSKITFEGKINKIQNEAEQEITLDFSQGYNIPLTYIQDGDMYGIKSELLGDKIVSVRNEGLKNLAERFEIDSTYVPDKICVDDYKFTEEEQKILKERYLSYIRDSLTEDMFFKTKYGKQKVITAKVPEENAVAIIREMANEFRNDEIILSKMPEGLDKESFQENIDKFISGLNDSENPNNRLDLSVYIEGKKLSKFEMIYYEDDEIYGKITAEIKDNTIETRIYEKDQCVTEISMKYDVTGDDVTTEMSIKVFEDDSEDITEIALKAEYKNLLTLDNVEENLTATVKAYEDEMKVNYTNSVTFDENVDINGIDQNKAVIINDATDEEIQAIILSVYQKLGMV